MEPREVKRIVAVGRQGVGKSWETIRMMLDEANGVVNGVPHMKPKRKGLIFDVNDEFGDFPFIGGRKKIAAIALKDITLFTVNHIFEVRRIRPFNDNGTPMSTGDMVKVLDLILSQFNNGILLVEDPTKYVSDTIDGDIIGKLISTRHRSTDMILHFQSIGKAGHPKIFANTSLIRMHKVSDTVSRHATKFEEKTELLQIAEFIVKKKYNEGNKRFFLWIDIDDSKIRGKFTKSDAIEAVHNYISENYNSAVKPFLLKRDMGTGELIYKDKAHAMEMARAEKLQTYFNFPSTGK